MAKFKLMTKGTKVLASRVMIRQLRIKNLKSRRNKPHHMSKPNKLSCKVYLHLRPTQATPRIHSKKIRNICSNHWARTKRVPSRLTHPPQQLSWHWEATKNQGEPLLSQRNKKRRQKLFQPCKQCRQGRIIMIKEEVSSIPGIQRQTAGSWTTKISRLSQYDCWTLTIFITLSLKKIFSLILLKISQYK